MDKQVFAIVGLGPAGGIMATYLTRAGHEVVIVDILKDHLDEIRDNGLVITGFQELIARFVLENICYSIDGLRGKKVDTIFIAVKTSLLEEVAAHIAKVVEPGVTLVSLQNGLDTEEIIAKVFGKENTLRVVVNYAGNIISKGRIRMSFFNAPNYIGAMDPASLKKAGALAEVITRTGLETAFTSNIKEHEWVKTILNSALGPICALTRRTMKQMMEFAATRRLVELVLLEGIMVAVANGIQLGPDFFQYCLEYLDRAGHHMPSMHMDLAEGKTTEVELLNQKIEEYGRAKGVPTPYNSALIALIRGAELPQIQGGLNS